MFSGFAVYVGEKIVLILRESLKQSKDNGVWLVFSETADLVDPSIHAVQIKHGIILLLKRMPCSAHLSGGRKDKVVQDRRFAGQDHTGNIPRPLPRNASMNGLGHL